MDYKKILNLEPTELIEWLMKEFYIEIPNQVISFEDMETASTVLIKLSTYYSYLCTLLSYAKINARITKREGSKTEYEDAVDKKEIIQNMTDSIKQQYAALSRTVTIKIENNQELRIGAGQRYGN